MPAELEPSESSRITRPLAVPAGGALPGASPAGRPTASASVIASPIGVPPSARSRFSPFLTALWSNVGETATLAVVENGTRLTLYDDGRPSTNCSAALVAAPRRVGGTSFATIEPDVSIARVTVACLRA